jgi:hypothetical protein
VLAVDEPRQEQAAEPAQLARWLSRAHRRLKVIAPAPGGWIWTLSREPTLGSRSIERV